jgi:hypothetical protein
MAVTTVINPNQSIENSPKKYIKTLTVDSNPTGVPIGSELWDAQADITYITSDGSTWHEKKRAKYEAIVYSPGLINSGDKEAATKTISATAEAAGLGSADYSSALTLSMACTVNGVAKVIGTTETRLAVTRIGTRSSITIESDNGTHDLRCRIYVDAQDANHLLYDLTFTSTGNQLSVQDCLAGTKETIFNLLKDNSAHTFYWFFWSPGNHSPVISVVQLWEFWGAGAGGSWTTFGEIIHTGDVEAEWYQDNVLASGTPYFSLMRMAADINRFGTSGTNTGTRARVYCQSKLYFCAYGGATNGNLIRNINLLLRSDT